MFADGPGARRGRQRPVSAKSGVPPASSIVGSAAWRSHSIKFNAQFQVIYNVVACYPFPCKCVHSKQGVFKEGPSTGGGADPAAPTRGGADPATSTNSTDAKGKLPRTSVRHALYNI